MCRPLPLTPTRMLFLTAWIHHMVHTVNIAVNGCSLERQFFASCASTAPTSFQISAHTLNIERQRYATNYILIWQEFWKIPGVESLVLRCGGLSLEQEEVPQNVYAKIVTPLSECILDETTNSIGKYLIFYFLCKSNRLGFTEKDMPNFAEVKGPKSWSKGVTIKRATNKTVKLKKSEREEKEDKRLKQVSKEKRQIDCFSSDMNACQAVVKPDFQT